jgi:cell wall-associated NlpC family hydrolase
MTREDVVTEARDWIGTPFRWQASLKRVGADCKGYIAGVARELAMPEAASVYAAMADYGARVPVATLKRGLAATLERVGEPEPGDVLLLIVSGKAQHLGFHAGDALLHTYSGKTVMASPLKGALRVWPLDSAWRFPSLVS